MSRRVPNALATAELRLSVLLGATPQVAHTLLPGLDEVVEGRVPATNAQRTHALNLARILRMSLERSDEL